MIPLICIEGPTASGKSSFALRLAKTLDTEIISADSRQIYKYLDIGTAKPDKQTLAEIKHHLIDIITPDQKYSGGAFVKDADAIIFDLHSKGKIPIVCGGSMLYIKSLIYGLSDIPPIPPEISIKTKDFMLRHTLAECYELIKAVDPRFAENISSTDTQRICRALDVWFAFETPLTEFWAKQEIRQKYKPFRIYIDRKRSELYDNINKRMLAMIEQGLINEIKSLLDMGYTIRDYGLNSLGYAEFLDDRGLRDAAEISKHTDLAAQHTRNYAKRQVTWYRKISFDLVVADEDMNVEMVKDMIVATERSNKMLQVIKI